MGSPMDSNTELKRNSAIEPLVVQDSENGAGHN